MELLKEKFGEKLLFNANIMIRDVADSRRIANHHASTASDNTVILIINIFDRFLVLWWYQMNTGRKTRLYHAKCLMKFKSIYFFP